jgi:hypothetical protein
MLEAGVPFPFLATLMGWSTATTVRMAKRYGQIGPFLVAAVLAARADLPGAAFLLAAVLPPSGERADAFLAASTTAVPRQRVFSATSVAWCFDHVTTAVTGLIRLEMIECLRTT